MKNVQISQDLFCDLILYHLYNNPSAEEAIRRELSRKLDAMICHERFTQYKTAATEAEREQARQRYLESIGSTPSPRHAPRSPSESARALLMRSVKSAFTLLLTRVTEPSAAAGKREEVRFYEENDQRRGR